MTSSAFAKGFHLRTSRYGGQVGETGWPGRLFIAALIAAWPGTTCAQEAPALRAHHFTVGGGVVWSGGYDIGDRTAQLRGNAAGAEAPPFTLFTSASRITPATSPELRVGFAVTRRVALEFGLTVSQPHVEVGISQDAEAPKQQLSGEKLEQYVFCGNVTWQLPITIKMDRRLAPFASGGVAFLRQLHEDRTLAEIGQVYHAGGGARYFLKGEHGTDRVFGLRGEARVNFRRNGIDFENTMRIYPTFSFSVFVGL
jgi:hypothetical protein